MDGFFNNLLEPEQLKKLSLQPLEKAVEFCAGKPTSAQHHPVDAARVCNVIERVCVEQDEISLGASLHDADIAGPRKEFRRIDSSGLQSLEWREAGIDQVLEFTMYGEAGYVEYLW
jgi:hypothetical protein